jgi:hypothetical protein
MKGGGPIGSLKTKAVLALDVERYRVPRILSELTSKVGGSYGRPCLPLKLLARPPVQPHQSLAKPAGDRPTAVPATAGTAPDAIGMRISGRVTGDRTSSEISSCSSMEKADAVSPL